MAEVTGVGVNPTAAYLNQLNQQQATKPQATPPGALPESVGYNPSEKSTFVKGDPKDTPDRFAKIKLGEGHADVNAEQMAKQIDTAFTSGQSIQVENTGNKKQHELKLTTAQGESRTFNWKKDEAPHNVAHEIHNWLDTQGVPQEQRNFQVSQLSADELNPTLDALGAANHVRVASLKNDSGKVNIDQAHFAHVDQNGRALAERAGTKIKIDSLGQKQKALNITGTEQNDTIFSRWSGAPTTIDGKAGNDALVGIGNGKSTYTIKDDTGKNFISLLNGDSRSKVTTGRASLNTIQVQSDERTKIESLGRDTMTLGGKVKHDVEVKGQAATVIQDSTSGHNYKPEDIKLGQGSVLGFSKEKEVYDEKTQQRVVKPQAQYYRGEPGFFGTNTKQISDAEIQYAMSGAPVPRYYQPQGGGLSPAGQLGITLGFALLGMPINLGSSSAGHHGYRDDYYGHNGGGPQVNFGFGYSGRS